MQYDDVELGGPGASSRMLQRAGYLKGLVPEGAEVLALEARISDEGELDLRREVAVGDPTGTGAVLSGAPSGMLPLAFAGDVAPTRAQIEADGLSATLTASRHDRPEWYDPDNWIVEAPLPSLIRRGLSPTAAATIASGELILRATYVEPEPSMPPSKAFFFVTATGYGTGDQSGSSPPPPPSPPPAPGGGTGEPTHSGDGGIVDGESEGPIESEPESGDSGSGGVVYLQPVGPKGTATVNAFGTIDSGRFEVTGGLFPAARTATGTGKVRMSPIGGRVYAGSVAVSATSQVEEHGIDRSVAFVRVDAATLAGPEPMPYEATVEMRALYRLRIAGD